jgi:signal peptidase I
MPLLTSAILALFVAYLGAWYLGALEGNFPLVLLLATVVTGLYWLAERFYFLPKRRVALAGFDAQTAQRNTDLLKLGIAAPPEADTSEARSRLIVQPWWLDWTAGLFPVIVAVFVLRSFLFEPFKIPTGSMIPTLLVGDLILVNKFAYGLRMPVVHSKITEGTPPARGDVMVFRYPPNPRQDYIKRVVGLPGDEVAYLNKKLTINGQQISKAVAPEFFEPDTMRYIQQFTEQLGARSHKLLNDDKRPAFVPGVENFPGKDNCSYSIEGVICKVPAGHYFMMGDNRDNSLDSRYWGFVPEANIVGKAFFVWMSTDVLWPKFDFSKLQRIGSFE